MYRATGAHSPPPRLASLLRFRSKFKREGRMYRQNKWITGVAETGSISIELSIRFNSPIDTNHCTRRSTGSQLCIHALLNGASCDDNFSVAGSSGYSRSRWNLFSLRTHLNASTIPFFVGFRFYYCRGNTHFETTLRGIGTAHQSVPSEARRRAPL